MQRNDFALETHTGRGSRVGCRTRDFYDVGVVIEPDAGTNGSYFDLALKASGYYDQDLKTLPLSKNRAL